MSVTSFTKKILRAEITLAEGTFGGTPYNTKIIQGLRMECNIEQTGKPSKNSAKLKIYGMRETDMAQLVSLSFEGLASRKNVLKIFAGDAEHGMVLAFQGTITDASTMYKTPPNLLFSVSALSGHYESIKAVSPVSKQGPVSVGPLLGSLAANAGFASEGTEDLDDTDDSIYLAGSALSQIATLCEAHNLDYGIENNTLWVTKYNAPRSGEGVLVSAETGMKEYPTFDKKGIHLETLYNPGIRFNDRIKVESRVPSATGTWRVYSLVHNLSCEHPGGPWLSVIRGASTKPGSIQPKAKKVKK